MEYEKWRSLCLCQQKKNKIKIEGRLCQNKKQYSQWETFTWGNLASYRSPGGQTGSSCVCEGEQKERNIARSQGQLGRVHLGGTQGKRKIHSQCTLSRFRPNKFSVRSNAPSDYSSLSDSQLLFGSQFCPENVQSAAAPLELGTQLGQHNSQDVSFALLFRPAHTQPPSKLMENTENRW